MKLCYATDPPLLRGLIAMEVSRVLAWVIDKSWQIRDLEMPPDRTIQGAQQRAEMYVAAMSHEEGIWQRAWPVLPQECLSVMQSGEWGAKLLRWPVGETL